MASVSHCDCAVLAFACLGGCTSLNNLKDSSWVSAEPLDARLVARCWAPGGERPRQRSGDVRRADEDRYLGLVNDSSDKCHAFADRIKPSQTELHATGDLRRCFSTLGTLFHPANAVRELSAGATLRATR